MTPLDNILEIELPKVYDPRGSLTFAEGGVHVPFPIKRVFYVYDIPGGATRGGHAHYTCMEMIMAVAGTVTVRLSDGTNEKTFVLDRANKALFVPAGLWLTTSNFTTGSIYLCFASEPYEEEDYIRDYEEFLEYSRQQYLSQQ